VKGKIPSPCREFKHLIPAAPYKKREIISGNEISDS
jgi:hypothetical protein